MRTDQTEPRAPEPEAVPPRPSGGHDQLPGLTGLRGLAVVAVVAYHLGYLKGGFVGVDLFFVLSGFLITSLLLKDTPEGTSGLLRWWGRRIRRLTPAVAVVVAVVLLAFVTTSGIALDGFATLTWWQNWHLVAEGAPYWDISPSPLRHAWSLSIEEQYYLLWPLVVVAVSALAGPARRRRVALAATASVLGVASFAWAAWLATRPVTDLSRIYYGTDTRAGALLAGATAAALMFRLRRGGGSPFRPAPRIWAPLAIPAAIALVVLAATMEPSQRWTYTGGLALAAACSLTLVMAATRSGRLATVLSPAPVQWLGTRSYAIYLWSWPIQIFLQSNWELPRAAVAAITVAVTLPAAELSMRLVEQPLRFGSGWATALRPRRAAWGLGAVVILALSGVAAASARPTVDEQLAQEFERLPDPTVAEVTTTTCVPAPPPSTVPQFNGDTGAFDDSTVTDVLDPTATERCEGTTRVLVLGDSTARGAANGLIRAGVPGLEVWDRSELGCGIVSDKPECPDWRTAWTEAVGAVQPDVVLVIARVWDDVSPGEEPPFLSDQGSAVRRQAFASTMHRLGAGGRRLLWNLPPVPLNPWYCDGEDTASPCDPDWVARWNEDLTAAAAETSTTLVDTGAWVESRGSTEADRPDGLHLSGPALDAQAQWLAEQIRAAVAAR